MTPAAAAVIMAHPARAGYLPELAAALGPDVPIVWDSGNNNRWDTGSRAMLTAAAAAAHHDRSHALVVQDDAITSANLLPTVDRSLAAIPADAAVCLFAGRPGRLWPAINLHRNGRPIPRRTSWLVMRQIHWGVGIAIPTVRVNEMVEWCDELVHVDNYDRRISRWCNAHDVDVYYPWPSLVDHRDGPSLVPGRQSRGRNARSYIGDDASAFNPDGDVLDLRDLVIEREHVIRGQGARNTAARRARLRAP